MGGRAFRSGPNPLNVVRLSPEQYIKLRDHYQSILPNFYNRVVVAPEAPEKTDHGDIDILVDEPLFNFTVEDLKQALGADARVKSADTHSFAIQIPEESGTYFQLDVHVCKKGYFEWECVMYSYGDLWPMIGTMVKYRGLSINNTGLHARIEEIESTNKKKSLVLLTSDPLDVMNFLGLDGARYGEGFSSLNDLFEWAIDMPLYERKCFEIESMNGKQKRNLEKRPMYSKFVTEWLPQKTTTHGTTAVSERVECVEQSESRSKTVTSAASCGVEVADHQCDEPREKGESRVSCMDERKDVLEKALLRFNKREAYHNILEDYRATIFKDAGKKKLTGQVPSGV